MQSSVLKQVHIHLNHLFESFLEIDSLIRSIIWKVSFVFRYYAGSGIFTSSSLKSFSEYCNDLSRYKREFCSWRINEHAWNQSIFKSVNQFTWEYVFLWSVQTSKFVFCLIENLISFIFLLSHNDSGDHSAARILNKKLSWEENFKSLEYYRNYGLN